MGVIIDITGKRYGQLTVLELTSLRSGSSSVWKCRCDCGNEKLASSSNLRSGQTTSCGCYRKQRTSECSIEDLTNRRFGSLFVISITEKRQSGNVVWLCKCSCGNTVEVAAGHLKSGHTQSCGCYQRQRAVEANVIHGKCYTAEYSVWQGILERCRDQSNEGYGGRGISVCERWSESFENFLSDMGERPSSNHSIDRVNNDGNYEPDNCRWATLEEQANNRRNNILVQYRGSVMTVAQASRMSGIAEHVLRKRLKLGWSSEKLFS